MSKAVKAAKYWMLVAVLLSFHSTCARGESKTLKIVASIQPLDIAESIAGDLAEVEVLVSGAASPHDFAINVGQALRLNDADILLWVGPDFEPFLTKGVQAKHKISFVNSSEVEHVNNPHRWLNNTATAEFSRRFAAKLKELLPSERSVIADKASFFLQELEDSHIQSIQLLKAHKSKPFVVYHDAYSGYVEAYGLAQKAQLVTVSHQKISAKRLAQISRDSKGAYCLLAEISEENVARRYANLLDLDLVLVDLLAVTNPKQSYSDYLRGLTAAFELCLDKKNPASKE